MNINIQIKGHFNGIISNRFIIIQVVKKKAEKSFHISFYLSRQQLCSIRFDLYAMHVCHNIDQGFTRWES